jgi:acyl carrier protein
MEKLLEILNTIDPNIDYMTETRLIDDGCLDSLLILSLVAELENSFEIEITPVDLVPANFNSAEAIWNMIKRLQEEN